MRSRESSCCSPPLPSPPPREIQNAACRHDHRRSQICLATTSRINSRIRWRHHDRCSNRSETLHRQSPLLFSTFGFATTNPECRVTSQSQTSQIFRRQLHAFTHPPAPPRSPFNSHRKATSPKRYEGNRSNSAQRVLFFQIREHPMLSQQQPVSVTPHRMSCPCLVSFSVGHYDVLVSTPDSMFSVV